MLVTITGNSTAPQQALQSLPARLDAALAKGLARGLLYTVGVAQRQFLSGPRPQKLDVRTTRLRNSIASQVQISGTGAIIGRIGSNVTYAAFHEFGFRGIVNVRAHARVLSTLNAAGNPIDQRKRDSQGFIKETHARANARKGSKAATVVTGQVRAHQRHLNYAGRPYLRPALELAIPTINDELKKEIAAL